MFKKTFKYGLLKNIKDKGWYFNDEKLEEKKFIKVLNKLGKEGWELIEVDNTIGFLFKKVE